MTLFYNPQELCANVKPVSPEALTKAAWLWSFALPNPSARRLKLVPVAFAFPGARAAATVYHRSTASKANAVQLVLKIPNAPAARFATTASASRRSVAAATRNAGTVKIA